MIYCKQPLSILFKYITAWAVVAVPPKKSKTISFLSIFANNNKSLIKYFDFV